MYIMIASFIYFILYTEIIMAAIPLWLNNNYSLRCQPKKIYRSEYGDCMCTEDGDWPNKYCRSYFQLQQNEQECKPNEYILVDCNICRCASNGKIDERQCTRHVCKNRAKNFRRSSHNTCQPGMWYTLSPCRICHCVDENKLLCNNHFDSPKVRIGKHELNMCGESLLEDMQELMFSNAKNTINNRIENVKMSKKGIVKDSIGKKGKLKKDKRIKKHQGEDVYKDYDVNIADTRTKFKENGLIEDKTVNNNIKDESDIFIATDVRWDDNAEEKETSEMKFQLPDILALAEKLWDEPCQRHSTVLNDCNWCYCDDNRRYKCKARVCEEVDMFGHFKDAIRDIDVGMEGHGSWRSTGSPCTAGVHYQRGGTLCVCDEDGNWPNAVCRDLFRVLHPVEVTGLVNLSLTYKCEPTKLYLVGCNVCFCPSASVLDPALCTNKECDEKDPVLEVKEGPAPVTQASIIENNIEIYASCNPKYKYKLGCMNCDCITNNRLLCFNCSDTQISPNTHVRNSKSNRNKYKNIYKKKYKNKDKEKYKDQKKKLMSVCDNKKPNVIFFIRCNACYCDTSKLIYCTSRNCKSKKSVAKDHFKISHTKLKQVKAPAHILNCKPGTKFQSDCNTCFCLGNSNKFVACTLKQCYKTKTTYESLKFVCLEGSYYELDCMLCLCYLADGVKREICEVSADCAHKRDAVEKQLKGVELKSLSSLHGYCEPLHRYKSNCNECRCLTDGKTLMCTSKVCAKRTSSNVSIDLVPVNMKTNEVCPRGHSYKLDCNICFCLSNGNAICTTTKCSE